MIRRTPVAAAAVLLSLGVAAPALASLPTSPRIPKYIGPTVVAWYDVARATASTPAAPMPGVGPKDLLVQGITIDTSALPVPLSPLPPFKQVTAFTALSFRIPRGATPASLSLKLTGLTTAKLDAKLPSGATPVACGATSRITAGSEQPLAAAPRYDCKRFAIGQVSTDRTSIVFPGIGRLLTGRVLSLVILPGSLGLERLVFAAPTARSLSLLSFTAPPTPGPATSVPPVSSATQPQPAASAAVPPVSVPPAANATASPLPAATPQIASPAPDVRPQALTTVAKPVNDDRARTAAIGGLVALIAITAWVAVTERRPRATVAGIGKFRAPRTGPPPAI